MDWIYDPQAWVALLTLTFLEIVLGIDNIVFLSILSSRVAEAQQKRARTIGLLLAMGTRLLLLLSLSWIMSLTQPWFGVLGHEVSGRDVIMLLGGLFLIWKSVTEIHHKLEGAAEAEGQAPRRAAFGAVIAQIAVLDLVFSLDSVITAVGMAQHLMVMVLAVVISVVAMLFLVNQVCAFVDRHPTVKMLALSFLLLIGFTLLGEGWGMHIPKGYVYFAMGFSVFVEALNLRLRRRGKPVALHGERPAE